jgi:hypothetical protein
VQESGAVPGAQGAVFAIHAVVLGRQVRPARVAQGLIVVLVVTS